MTILVVGAGATGGYFGARLALAGRDVSFLVHSSRAEQLRERGLRIIGQGADQVVAPRLVTADQLVGHADVVLVSVKATALEAAVADFAPAVGPRTLVIPFLNGMSHLAVLNGRFGEQAVLGGVVLVATQLSDEGDIVQLAASASLQIGAQDRSRTDRLQAAYDELFGAGFERYRFLARCQLACVLRRTCGEATGTQPGSSSAERAAVNTGTARPRFPAAGIRPAGPG